MEIRGFVAVLAFCVVGCSAERRVREKEYGDMEHRYRTKKIIQHLALKSGYPTEMKSVIQGTCPGEEGTITSPNYPGDYPNNYKCTRTIEIPTGKVAVISVDDMQIEDSNHCYYDALNISDSAGQTPSVLCGSHRNTCSYVARGNEALVIFDSDVSLNGMGFKISYSIEEDRGQSTEHCESQMCTGSYISCNGSDDCILPEWVCDGMNDCTNASDETDCPPRECFRWEWDCGNGRCIPDAWVCDGEDDCGDRQDEGYCEECTAYQWECDDGTCIPASYLCDELQDCDHNEDEAFCPDDLP